MLGTTIKEMKTVVRAAEVRGIIKFHALYRKTVTYREVSESLGLFCGGADFFKLLGMVSREDHRKGQPLSSAIVVSKGTGVPSYGFFDHAQRIGAFDPNAQSKEEFWLDQMQRLGYDVAKLNVKLDWASPVQPELDDEGDDDLEATG
jgi:hypothetical protein